MISHVARRYQNWSQCRGTFIQRRAHPYNAPAAAAKQFRGNIGTLRTVPELSSTAKRCTGTQTADSRDFVRACRDGIDDVELMEYLVKSGADINATDTLVSEEEFTDRLGKVYHMRTCSIDEATALHFAAWHGLSEVCSFLLKHDDFHLTNAKAVATESTASDYLHGSTALMLAIQQEHINVCHALLQSERFTEINARRQACVSDMEHTYPRVSTLTLAVEIGLPSVCRALLRHRLFDIRALNGRANWGVSMLSLAAAQSENDQRPAHFEIAKMILADRRFELVNDVNAEGHPELAGNALHHAARTGNVDIARLLLQQEDFTDQSVNCRNEWGETALQLAQEYGHKEICSLLLGGESRFSAK